MNGSVITRWIRGYDKKRGELRNEWRLPDSVQLELLQDLFGARRGDPMYDCYRVGHAQAEALAKWLDRDLSDPNCDFFLEADAAQG